jgi:hypothetical protein
MNDTVEKLDTINRTLERLNGIMQKMLDMMPKPESKFNQVFDQSCLLSRCWVFSTLLILSDVGL